MMAIQVPDGRYLSASWAGNWELKLGVDPYDFANIYHEGSQVFAMRAGTSKKQEVAMLNRLAKSIGFKDYKGMVASLDADGDHMNNYPVKGHSYNIVTDNCTTRLWGLLSAAGYYHAGWSNSVPNSLFDLYYDIGLHPWIPIKTRIPFFDFK